MGAIGGIVDFRNGNIDFSAFNAISKAQILRGRKSSVAYVDSNVGMFYNSDGSFEISAIGSVDAVTGRSDRNISGRTI